MKVLWNVIVSEVTDPWFWVYIGGGALAGMLLAIFT